MTASHAPGSHEAPSGYSSFEPEPEQRLAVDQLVAAGRYRVTRELGQGGMAIVYAAEDLRTGRAVALKVVMHRLADRDDATARYHNEARLAAALGHHPHVVHPLEVGRLPELHDRLFLATELVDGRSLGAVVLEQPRGLAIDRVCRIGRDAARALVALHERGIVHRDIKPGNIMLEQRDGHERARLLDFGCAYATGDGGVAASPDLTAAHERVGSPIYMAPEQALGLRPTPSFDLYALGATLYELLTGAPPYAGSSKAEVVQRKCAAHDPPLPVARVRDGIPPRLAALVDGCLAREASERPATAMYVLRELETVLGELGHGHAEQEGRSSSRWRRLAAPAAVLALAGVLGAVALEVGESGSTEPIRAGSSPPAVPSVDLGSPRLDERTSSSTSSGEGSPGEGSSGEPVQPVTSSGSPTTGSIDDGITPSSEGSSDDGAAAPEPRPKPSSPRWSTTQCERIRAQAAEDRVARRWQPLLDAVTHDRKCWREGDERLVLRLTALSGLGRHEECARLGASSMDRQIRRIASQCQHELSGGE